MDSLTLTIRLFGDLFDDFFFVFGFASRTNSSSLKLFLVSLGYRSYLVYQPPTPPPPLTSIVATHNTSSHKNVKNANFLRTASFDVKIRYFI